MGRNLAKLISYVTSAPLIAIYNIPIICLKEQNCLVASLIAFLFLTFFPVAPIIHDARKGRTDIFVAQRGKRLKFFTLTIINHFVGFLLSLFFKLKVLPLYILCYFTVTLTILVITLKWKISVHTAGVAGPVTFIVLFFGFAYSLLYLLLIPVAWARLKMKAHTRAQVILGAVVAVLVTFLTVKCSEIGTNTLLLEIARN